VSSRRLAPGLAWAACAAALAIVAPGCAPDPASPTRSGGAHVVRAELCQSAADTAPPEAAACWKSVALPDYWTLRRRRDAIAGWYRVDFEARPAPGEAWALSLSGGWSRLSAFLNDRPVAEWSSGDRSAAIGPLGVLYAPLPKDALRSGTNRLTLHFAISPAAIGALEPFDLAPAALLEPAHRRDLLLRDTLPFALTLFGVASGVLVLALSRWDPVGSARWFAAGTLCWSGADLAMRLRLPVGAVGDWLFSVVAHAFVPCLVVGFHRVLGVQRPRFERALAYSVLGAAALRGLARPLLRPFVDNLWWLANAGLGVYLVYLAVGNWRRGRLTPGWLVLGATLFVLGAGVVDLASLIRGAPILGLSLFDLARPLIGLTAAAVLVSLLGRSLSLAEELNLELERRVEEKRSELAASYTRVAELERARTIAAERDRLMRDMHDGTGGQLVSALAMVEGGEFTRDALADALRDALADLRLTIDSLDPAQPDLVPLLAMARARLEPRLEPQGLRFAWDVRDVARPEGFGPHAALQVLRVFQEAVTNALRHARATTLVVRTGEERDAAGRACAFVEIADDGRGFEAAGPGGDTRAGGGRGLRNMQRRAAELGGELILTSGPGGTSVRLRLPL